MGAVNYLLAEDAVGYALFQVLHQADSVGLNLPEVKESLRDLSRFGKMVKVVNFTPWQSAAKGLENINLISEGILSDDLKHVIELSLPKSSGKKGKIVLAVNDKKLAAEIAGTFPYIECETPETSDVALALLRGVRVHSHKLLKGLREGDMDRAHLGLGHAYSRAKVKFSVHKNDNHIIQAIATVDVLDKDINQNAMRVREWYSWHFPELIRIVSDNILYAQLVLQIGDKKTLTDASIDELANTLNQDKDKAEAIVGAAKISMGRDILAVDLERIQAVAKIVTVGAHDRRVIADSLDAKMRIVAPNLQALLGTAVAARLISHAGSLTNLAKYPASTLQILGAEKALFRALKTKGNTPKYGLIYQSSFIGRANTRIKGRISRYLANKCSMAARIDLFSEKPSPRFGEVMKQQMEERLEFYASGKKPMRNTDAMDQAVKAVLDEDGDMDIDTEMIESHAAPAAEDGEKSSKKEKKEKKDKKEKKEKKSKAAEDVEMADVNGDGEKKKKKKKKSLSAE